MIRRNTRCHLPAMRYTDRSRDLLYGIRRVGERTHEKDVNFRFNIQPILVDSAPLAGIPRRLQMIISASELASRMPDSHSSTSHHRHAPEDPAAGYVPALQRGPTRSCPSRTGHDAPRSDVRSSACAVTDARYPASLGP